MFAVVEINDKQHLVEVGQIFTIDGTTEEKAVSFDSVLMVQTDQGVQYGTPHVSGVVIHADVIESGKREKDVVFKFKRKTGYKVTRGHRQNSTLVKITKIDVASSTPVTE